MKMRTGVLVAVALLALAGCGGEDEGDGELAIDSAAQNQAPMDGMPGRGPMGGMGGMAGMGPAHDSAMVAQMEAHMARMMAGGADSVRAMMPRHRQMAESMLGQMESQMQQSDVAGDTAWAATLDSLRQDITRMGDMSVEELQAFLPEHRARMARLREMHRTAMGER